MDEIFGYLIIFVVSVAIGEDILIIQNRIGLATVFLLILIMLIAQSIGCNCIAGTVLFIIGTVIGHRIRER